MLPSDIHRKLQNMNPVGKIVAVDLTTAPGLVRVEIDQGVYSDWMPCAMPFIGGTWIWCAPKIGVSGTVMMEGGEDDVCRFAPNYFDESNYPYLSEADFKIHFDNGDEIHHNTESGTLTLNSSANVIVNTQIAEVHAPTITLDGDTTIEKSLTVKGFTNLEGGFAMSGSGKAGTVNIPIDFKVDPTINGKKYSQHHHSGVQAGGDQTGGVV